MTNATVGSYPNEESALDTPWGIDAYLRSGVIQKGQFVRRTPGGGMSMTVTVQGLIRGSTQPTEFTASPEGAMFTNQHLPRYQEITRSGIGWSTMQTSATAALVVRPTTVTGLELWNGSNQLSMVVDRLFSHELVTSTTGLGGGAGIWAMVTTPKASPSSASLVIVGTSNKGYSGAVVNAVGTTVTANGWFPYGTALKKESAGAVVPGGQLEALIEGRIIVPPQCSLCVTVVSGYAADTFCSGATWYEYNFGQFNPLT